jgi:hypothetical protein
MPQLRNVAAIVLSIPVGLSLAQDSAAEAPIRAIVANQVAAGNAAGGES